MDTQTPEKIELHKRSRMLELAYQDQHYQLSAEFLRVHSPSAEVQQHGNPILQSGKQFVAIERIEPIGHYGVLFIFSDNHRSGIYSWDYLYDLCCNHDHYWQKYLQALDNAGQQRSPKPDIVKFVTPKPPTSL